MHTPARLFVALAYLLPSALCYLALSATALADSDAIEPIPSCIFDSVKSEWVCAKSIQAEGSERIGASARQRDLDWLPSAYLNLDTSKPLFAGCTGAYVDPLAGELLSDADIDTLPLVIEADSATVVDVDTATLLGDVRVSQGPRSITSQQMSYERTRDEAQLLGGVTIRQPGMLIRGEEAKISTIEQQGKFSKARFVMHATHMRGEAESIEQQGPNRILLRNGAISSCEPDSNAWSLQGEELSVNQEKGQGYGKNVQLRLGGVPVFYLPYISFPIGDERRSGFLFPSISSSDDGGLDISAPYYLNLAPNYDLTLTPRLITGRGAMIEIETRHLSKYFLSSLSASYLGNDSGGNLTTADGERLLNQNQGNNRWLFQVKQSGVGGGNWYSDIDFTKTSDTDYFRDLGTSSFAVSNTTYLNQSIEGGIAIDHWHLSARVQDYQTLLLNLDAPYRKVPELTADGHYEYKGFDVDLKNQMTRFDHRDAQRLDGSPIIRGERFSSDYRIGRTYSNAGAYFRPEAGYRVLSYRLRSGDSDPLKNENITLAAGQFSADVGAVFEHTGGEYLQTLEPRAKYFVRQYQNHDELYNATASGQGVNFDTTTRNFSYGQLYRDTRFSGADRLDDANQVTVGLTNRWFGNDGHELFNVSLGRINHLQDRRIGLEREVPDATRSSEWALEFGAYWRDGSSLFTNLLYDDETKQVARLSSGYNYASDDQLSLYTIGYTYLRADPEITESEELDQLDAAFVSPISRQWFAMGRANYDIENRQELETFLGFEYNNCCYRIRVLARRWLDSNIANLALDNDPVFDQGLFFELHLKGLGGSGAKLNQILEDAIPGYRRRENALNNH